MKRLLSCVAVVLVLLIFSLYGFSYVNNMAQEIIDMVNDIAGKYEQRMYNEASQIAEYARKCCHDLSEGTVFLDDCDYGIELNATLARVSEYAKRQNDDIFVELKAAESLLEAFVRRQCPSFENIL